MKTIQKTTKRPRGRPRKTEKKAENPVPAPAAPLENVPAADFVPAPAAETAKDTAEIEKILDEKTEMTEKMPEGVAPSESYIPESAPAPEEVNAESVSARASAQTIVAITESSCVMILGSEMQMSESERDGLVSAWENYFLAEGVIELPPWATLLVANFTYFALHVQNEKVLKRISAIWEKISGKRPEKVAEKA